MSSVKDEKENYDPRTQLALLRQDVSYIVKNMDDMKVTLSSNYVTVVAFTRLEERQTRISDRLKRIETIAYSFVGILSLAVIYGLINLIPGLRQ